LTSWIDVFRAQLFASVCWYRNNKWMIFSSFVWPYLMVGFLVGLGSLSGSIENYAERIGVSNPLFFLLSSTVIAMSSLLIVFSVTRFALENRWLGTLPYILLSPVRTTVIFIASGLPDAIITPTITVASIVPAALYLEGLAGGLKILAVLAIVLFGMMPLVGFSVLVGSALLFLREESNIADVIAPLVLLVSGIYYPLEILPEVLQLVGLALPTTYVVEAAKLISAYLTPETRLLLTPVYVLTALTFGYNLIASLVIDKAERAVKRKGVL